jgi:hypothetical protein
MLATTESSKFLALAGQMDGDAHIVDVVVIKLEHDTNKQREKSCINKKKMI